jgi:uncharacterized protein YcfL
MRRLAPALLLALLLSGCGNDQSAKDMANLVPSGKALAASFSRLFHPGRTNTPDPAAVAVARAALEKAGQPVIMVSVAKTGYFNLMAPYGQNGPITTWEAPTFESVALRDGMLVATRGFGPDLMSAKAPDIAMARSGSGFFHRSYYDTDGADQIRQVEYDCTFAPSGTESVTVLGLAYVTRKVTETCERPDATIYNLYWFDQRGILRQSDQHVSPDLPVIRLQRVIG